MQQSAAHKTRQSQRTNELPSHTMPARTGSVAWVDGMSTLTVMGGAGRSRTDGERRSGFTMTPIDPRILASLGRSTTQPSPVNTFTTTIQPPETRGKPDEECYPSMAG